MCMWASTFRAARCKTHLQEPQALSIEEQEPVLHRSGILVTTVRHVTKEDAAVSL